MRDIKGFCKLFEINIPDYNHFDYYIDQLSKLEKWKDVRNLLELYLLAEGEVGDVFDFKVQKSNQIIDFIKSTRAYAELNDDNLIPDLPTTKNFSYNDKSWYLSVDIRMANWYILKKYDPDFLNELGDSWEGLLNRFGMPEVFHHSKSLRQFIFGNLNPKRQIKAQRVVIQELINRLEPLQLSIACVKNDEVIFELDDISIVEKILSEVDTKIFKTKLYKVERVDDFRINHYYNPSGSLLYKDLVGCNSHIFYLNLKKLILLENIDIRDLFFRMDGNLAIWNYEGLKLELN